MMYFAKDGNYGEADGLVIIDTRLWNEDDWNTLEFASDWERPALAIHIDGGYA